MIEETAIRVQINAAKLAGQSIFGILQAVANMLQAWAAFGWVTEWGFSMYRLPERSRKGWPPR